VQQAEAEGVVSSAEFAQRLQKQYGLDAAQASGDTVLADVGRNLTLTSCRIPDDHLSKRLWKLTLAREGLGRLLQTLKAQSQ